MQRMIAISYLGRWAFHRAQNKLSLGGNGNVGSGQRRHRIDLLTENLELSLLGDQLQEALTSIAPKHGPEETPLAAQAFGGRPAERSPTHRPGHALTRRPQ